MLQYRVFYRCGGDKIYHTDVIAEWKSDAMVLGGVQSVGDSGSMSESHTVLDAISEPRLPQMWWDEFATRSQKIADAYGALELLRKNDLCEYRTPEILLKRSVGYAKRKWKYLPSDMRQVLKRNNQNYSMRIK